MSLTKVDAVSLSALYMICAAIGCADTPQIVAPPRAPAARHYRTLTKHTPESVRANRHRLDWDARPALYRSYPGAQTVPLPPPSRLERPALDTMGAPASAGPGTARVLDLDLLGTILFLTGGITGSRPTSGGDIRATASAGALYPNELYVVTGDLSGLAAGVYHFDPKHRRLSTLREGDWRGALAAAAAEDRVRTAPATIVLTGILWRSAWKYEDRAYRHLHWDGGMMLAHILAAAAASGLPAQVLALFVDADADRLIGADGRNETTLALVPLGGPAPGGSGAPTPSRTRPRPLRIQPHPSPAGAREYPEVLRYHAASLLRDAGSVLDLRKAPGRRRNRTERSGLTTLPLPPDSGSRAPSLDAVIHSRRSTRRFAERPISTVDLSTVLRAPTRGAPADFLRNVPTLIETYVIVNAVRGVEPGAYYYRRTEHEIELLRTGNLRASAGFLCLDQTLAHDASAVLYYLADLEAIAASFGERGYRLAELEAGLTAGRAYLAAYALGRGASGLTFYDDEVTRFFSPHAAGLQPLLVVAVGVPRRRS